MSHDKHAHCTDVALGRVAGQRHQCGDVVARGVLQLDGAVIVHAGRRIRRLDDGSAGDGREEDAGEGR